MAAKKKVEKKFVVLGSKSYGLYCGLLVSFDTKEGTAVVKECRNIRYWYGKTGGITSLAAHGLCGPRAAESRIGAPIVSATLRDILNVYECSAEAAASLRAAVQS